MTKYSREQSGLGTGDAANDKSTDPEVTETTTESGEGVTTTTTTEAPTE